MQPRRRTMRLVVALAATALSFLATTSPTFAAFDVGAARTGQDETPFEFSERIVAGGADDYMTVRHLRLRGTQRAIGRKLAEIAAERHHVDPVELDPAILRGRRAFYRESYPRHLERASGVDDTYGLTPEDGLDGTALPYNLPRKFACSVVFYPPTHTASGHATLSRNYDWSVGTWRDLLGPTEAEGPRTTEDPYVIEVYPDRGYASLYLCAYELLGGCLDGINSEGLTVALLANQTADRPQSASSFQSGLSEVEIARYVLENCATVEEARQALATVEFYYLFIPCHYIIGDRTGDSFVWEYSADRSERFVTDGGRRPQWVTNHPVAPHPTVESLPASLDGNTHARFRRLHEEIADAPVERSREDMKRTNRCVAAVGSARVPTRTLWHALYDCDERSLEIDFYLGEDPAHGGERRSDYLRFHLEGDD